MFDLRHNYELTEKHRRLYAAEQLYNFRWIFKILARRSTHVLTEADSVSSAVTMELNELGQFAEAAYCSRRIPLDLILRNVERLIQPGFLLEGYTAIQGVVLISTFKGRIADLPGYAVYRPLLKQLVVAISGTSTAKHAYHDIRTLKVRHPSGRGHVHAGFYSLYKGIKPMVLDAIAKGLKDHDVEEIVITGHSMGGSLSYLLGIDLLGADSVDGVPLPPKFQIAVYGSPRTGDSALAKYWWELVDTFRNVHGQDSFKEYSVKAYNDGVPSLPPSGFGFCHFAREPIYLDKERLYHIPREASEDALFTVAPPTRSEEHSCDFPLGGHNYYHGRDHERFFNRTSWLLQAKFSEDGWEDRYQKLLAKHQG